MKKCLYLLIASCVTPTLHVTSPIVSRLTNALLRGSTYHHGTGPSSFRRTLSATHTNIGNRQAIERILDEILDTIEEAAATEEGRSELGQIEQKFTHKIGTLTHDIIKPLCSLLTSLMNDGVHLTNIVNYLGTESSAEDALNTLEELHQPFTLLQQRTHDLANLVEKEEVSSDYLIQAKQELLEDLIALSHKYDGKRVAMVKASLTPPESPSVWSYRYEKPE